MTLITKHKGGIYLRIQPITENDLGRYGRKEDWLWIYRDRFGKFPDEYDYSDWLLKHKGTAFYKNFAGTVLALVEKCFKENPKSDMVRVFSDTSKKGLEYKTEKGIINHP